LGYGNGGGNTNHRGEGKHQSYHDSGEVTSKDSIYDYEDMLILQLLEAKVDSSREQPDEHVEIEEEGRPSGRLMLGHGGDNRNMNLGVAGIPERVESARPRRNVTGRGQSNKCEQASTEHSSHSYVEESLELAARNCRSDVFQET
jgi:hypothetical protein